MKTTTGAGRTWHFSHALGRPTNEHNGKTGGYRYPVSVAVAPDDILFVLNRGYGGANGPEGPGLTGDCGRIGKTTLDEEHLGDFARTDFTWPNSVAISRGGELYVTDEYENCVKVYNQEQVMPYPEFDPDGEWQRKWGEGGSGEGQLNGPAGIVFDSRDEAFVVDSKGHRVQKFTTEGEFIMGWGGNGSDHGCFNLPWGVTVDSDDNVYVADWGNHRIQKFTNSGDYLASFGEVDGLGGELRHPSDVAVDSDGDVYVADFGNRRVQIYEPEGDVIAALYGDAVELSKAGEYIIRRDPGTIKAYQQADDYTEMGRFQHPTGIEVDAEDRIIVTDSCGRLQVYSKDHEYAEPDVKLYLEP